MKIFLIILLSMVALNSFTQDINKTIQQGNILYREQKYDLAETEYNNALQQQPSNTMARFNLGNAVYRRGKQTEAAKTFEQIAVDTKDPALRSKAFYNKGVVLSNQQKLEESIDAYKNALRQDPNDNEARENLQKALLELKKKDPPKKKEDEKKKQPQKQQQQKPKPQPKMNKKESEQRLKLLEQKEKEVQERLQKEKSKAGGGQAKDW